MSELDDPVVYKAFQHMEAANPHDYVCEHPGCYFMGKERQMLMDYPTGEWYCPVHYAVLKKERRAVATVTYRIVGVGNAILLAGHLTACSVWFECDPLPDEEWDFKVKDEPHGQCFTQMISLLGAEEVGE